MHPEQKRIFQAMTPEKKLQLMQQLYYSAWQLKESALKETNPNWTEGQIKAKVKQIFLYART